MRIAEKKLRAAQTVKRRYEQALERANSIIDQQGQGQGQGQGQQGQQRDHPSTSSSSVSNEQLTSFMAEMKAIEGDRDQYKTECFRLAEACLDWCIILYY